MDDDPTPRRGWLSRRSLARIVFVMTLICCVIYPLWMSFAPPPKFPISAETTHFLEPLTPDGKLDFEAAWFLANGFREDTTEPDAWDRLTDISVEANEHSRRLVYHEPQSCIYDEPADRHTEEGRVRDYRDKLRMTRPFSRDEDPEYTAVIEKNERWYQAILDVEHEIRPRPSPYHPFPRDPYDEIGLSPVDLKGSFQLRCMSQIGNGDQRGAVESIRFMGRLFERQYLCPSVRHHVAWAIGRGGTNQIARRLARVALMEFRDPSDDLLNCVQNLTADSDLHNQVADAIDGVERYACLADLSDPCWSSETRRLFPSHADAVKFNWFLHRIDWHRYARFHHAWFDGLSERFRISDPSERRAALAAYRNEATLRFSGPVPNRDTWEGVTTGDVTRIIEQQLISHATFEVERSTETDMAMRKMTRIVAAIAMFRSTHDRLPDSLNELRHADYRAMLRSESILDEWQYERSKDGFKLAEPKPRRYPAEFEWPLPDVVDE